jgi:pSer/pThr/pTyr-binding forkhead associated (FHA) protein
MMRPRDVAADLSAPRPNVAETPAKAIGGIERERDMSDETVIIPKAPPSFAYLFWLGGTRRGDHAMVRTSGTTIGRASDADVRLDDETASAEHARIRKEQGEWYLYDLASANTTKVGGQPVTRRRLSDGDRLQIGLTEFAFRDVR